MGDFVAPTVAAGEAVVAVPLGADEFDVSQHAAFDQLVGVFVKHAVVPLVADREQQLFFARHANHLLALRDVVGHQLFGEDVHAGLQASSANAAC